jgi:hypothetical protein
MSWRVIKTLRREVVAATPTPRVAPHCKWMKMPLTTPGAWRGLAPPNDCLPNCRQYQAVPHPNQWWRSSQPHQPRSFQDAANSDVKAPALMPILRGGPGVGYAARLYLPPGHTRMPENFHTESILFDVVEVNLPFNAIIGGATMY